MIAILGVSEDLHDHARVNPLRQEKRRARMPQVVDVNPAETGVFQHGPEAVRNRCSVQRRADCRREDEARLLPPFTAECALLLLLCAVTNQG